MKMESLQQRGEELERKEFQLKESLLKFDKFLKVRCSILFASEYADKYYKHQNNIKLMIFILIGCIGKRLQESKSSKKGSRRKGDEKGKRQRNCKVLILYNSFSAFVVKYIVFIG